MKAIKILHLITDLGRGGAERFLIDLLHAFRNDARLQMKVIALNPLNLWEEELKGFDVEVIDYKNFSLKGAVEQADYKRILEEFKPDIIHSHRFLGEFLSSYFVSPDIAYVTHGHDNMVQLETLGLKSILSREKVVNWFERRKVIREKYRRVPVNVIANSKHTLSFYKRVIPDFGKTDVRIIPYGFNSQKFLRTQTHVPSDGVLRLVNVGSFSHKKNQRFLVEVASQLNSNGVAFTMTLVGDGALRPEVEQLVRSKGLSEHFTFTGQIPDVERVLGESDVYVHAAYYEPFGLVFLEAMASGLPIVTLNGKGNVDIIRDGETGYVVDPENAAVFASRIARLAEDAELREDLTSKARLLADEYDFKKVKELYFNYYSHLHARA